LAAGVADADEVTRLTARPSAAIARKLRAAVLRLDLPVVTAGEPLTCPPRKQRMERDGP
jgi:hypothetical protein